jgi:hypothetical protein
MGVKAWRGAYVTEDLKWFAPPASMQGMWILRRGQRTVGYVETYFGKYRATYKSQPPALHLFETLEAAQTWVAVQAQLEI